MKVTCSSPPMLLAAACLACPSHRRSAHAARAYLSFKDSFDANAEEAIHSSASEPPEFSPFDLPPPEMETPESSPFEEMTTPGRPYSLFAKTSSDPVHLIGKAAEWAARGPSRQYEKAEAHLESARKNVKALIKSSSDPVHLIGKAAEWAAKGPSRQYDKAEAHLEAARKNVKSLYKYSVGEKQLHGRRRRRTDEDIKLSREDELAMLRSQVARLQAENKRLRQPVEGPRIWQIKNIESNKYCENPMPRGSMSTSLVDCKAFCEGMATCNFITYYSGEGGCNHSACLVDGAPSRCGLSETCFDPQQAITAPTAIYEEAVSKDVMQDVHVLPESDTISQDSYIGFAGGGHRAQSLTLGALRGLVSLEDKPDHSKIFRPHYYGAVSGSTWALVPYLMMRRKECDNWPHPFFGRANLSRLSKELWDTYLTMTITGSRGKHGQMYLRKLAKVAENDISRMPLLLWRTGILEEKEARERLIKDIMGGTSWYAYRDHWLRWVDKNIVHGENWSAQISRSCRKVFCPILVAVIENAGGLNKTNKTDGIYDPMAAGDMYEAELSDCSKEDKEPWVREQWAHAMSQSSNGLGTRDMAKGMPLRTGLYDFNITHETITDGKYLTVVDGGKLDTYALFPALKKQIPRIVIWSDAGNQYRTKDWRQLIELMRNDSSWLVPPSSTQHEAFELAVWKCMMPHLPALFGIYLHHVIPSQRSDFRKATMWRWQNQVFERHAFRGLVEALFRAKHRGRGTVATVALRTVRNEFLGVEPYDVLFTFVSVEVTPKWQNLLGKFGVSPRRECKQFEANRLPIKVKSLVKAQLGYTEPFPFLMMDRRFSAICSSLLAHLATFVVHQNVQHFRFDLRPQDADETMWNITGIKFEPCVTNNAISDFRDCRQASRGSERLAYVPTGAYLSTRRRRWASSLRRRRTFYFEKDSVAGDVYGTVAKSSKRKFKETEGEEEEFEEEDKEDTDEYLPMSV